MKKTTIRLFRILILICSLFPLISSAQNSPPRLINLQAVLVDEGGNVLYNQQEADIIFSIVDGAGETFYEEEQHVVLVNGAISVLVGQGIDLSTGGATGGIPLAALEPNGTKLLRVKLKDQSIPQEDLELATVPYAMYADKAYSLVEPLESEGILDGTITQSDLSPELIAYIDDRAGGASEDQLAQHRQDDGAHPASNISVVNTFINASGNNVQQILVGLDRAIGTRRNQEGVLGEEIDEETADRTAADVAETAAREAAVSAEAATRAAAVATEAASRAAADTAEATTRATEDTRVLESEISRAGDSIYGDLVFYTDDTLSTETMRMTPATGDVSTSGELSLLGGLMTLERDGTTSDPVLSLDDTDGVERLRLDGDTGLMTIDGSVTITGTVDGVDVNVEQATRIAADEAEREARIEADTAEQGMREAADAAELTARETADSTLQTNIDTERVSRETADTSLSGAIDSEASTRVSADDTLRITVEGAQSTADTAVSDASTAQTTANTAVTNAAAAQTTANDANTAAAVAQTTANTAVTNAATAQTTADSKVSRSGDTMSGDLVVPNGWSGGNIDVGLNLGYSISRINTLYSDKVNKSGDTMTGDLTMNGGNIIMGAGATVDGVNVSQMAMRIRRTGQVVMPLTNAASIETRTVTAPSDDYVACGAWGVLDAFRVTGGGGDFDNDDLWGFQGTGDTGSAVTWQLVGSNTPGSTKSVQISFHSQGDDAVYAGRGFVLFARGISCVF